MYPNIRQVELFYHAYIHGGVTKAAPKVGRGITPSAISKQICLLEEDAGKPLFERRPFRPTLAGVKLFNHISPMFGGLPGVFEEIRSDQPDVVRLAASPIVYREYLSPILRAIKARYPGIKLVLCDGLQKSIEKLLKARSLDLAIAPVDGEIPPGYRWEPLMRIPLALLVPAGSKIKSARELWGSRRHRPTLVGVPAENAIARCFQQGLQQQGVDWPVQHEVSSMLLVEQAVRDGLGFGITVELLGRPLPRFLRVLPLPGFPRVCLGMILRLESNEVTSALADAMRAAASQMVKANRRIAPE